MLFGALFQGLDHLRTAPPEADIDAVVLEALPPEIRAEVLEEEARPAPASEIDNASFIASLDPMLREEVLLSAPEARRKGLVKGMGEVDTWGVGPFKAHVGTKSVAGSAADASRGACGRGAVAKGSRRESNSDDVLKNLTGHH